MENKTRKQVIAGAIAAVLTLGTAGAAVALNLGTAADEDPSPAGQLTATSPPTTAPTPSTIYIDVPGSAPDPSASSGSSVSPRAGSTAERDEDEEHEDEEHEDEEHEDEEHEVEKDDDHEDAEHEEYEGREDDD
jgi:hypothetical protein